MSSAKNNKFKFCRNLLAADSVDCYFDGRLGYLHFEWLPAFLSNRDGWRNVVGRW
jgi:hypothetical protein